MGIAMQSEQPVTLEELEREPIPDDEKAFIKALLARFPTLTLTKRNGELGIRGLQAIHNWWKPMG
jgi:hypothetical protein